MVENRKNLIPIAIIIAGLLIAGAFVYVNQGKVSEKAPEGLSPQQAAEKAINYINQNLLQGGATASLINVVEENGIYKFRLKIGQNEYDSYVTKNGKLLFIQGIDLEKPLKKVEEPKGEPTIGDFLVSEDEICKEDGKPIVYFFGSKGCPHC